MSVNKVILVGNVGQDPEIRTTSDGREVASFSIATTDSWKDKGTGEKKDKTEWHRVVVFSQGLVGIVKNYVKKGSKLYIEGQLQTRKWTDNNGVDKYTTEVVLQNFNSTLQMLGSRDSSSGSYSEEPASYGKSSSTSSSSGGKTKVDDNSMDDLDDEIPF